MSFLTQQAVSLFILPNLASSWKNTTNGLAASVSAKHAGTVAL